MNLNQTDTKPMALEELEKNVRTMIPDLKIAAEKSPVENPFVSEIKLTKWDKISMVLFSFLVPVRLILLGIVVCTSNILAWLLLIGYKESNPPTPMTGLRKLGRTILLTFNPVRVFCFICGFHKINVKGKVSDEARVIIGVPHSGFMDAFLFAAFVGDATVVGRAEDLTWSIDRLFQPIPVSRKDKDSRESAIKEIKRRAGSKDWAPIFLCPEGTCTNRKAYTFFKPGAFYPGQPVQPIIVRYLDKLDYVTWTWIGPGHLPLSFLMLSRLNNRAEIEYLPVYKPTQEEIDNPLIFSKNVRDYVAAIDNIPVTDHSYEDCRLMEEAKRLNLPMKAGLIEYYKMSPIIGMNCDAMMEYFGKFAKINRTCNGVIELDEFCNYLNLPPAEEVKTMFRIYDIDRDDAISFRDFLLGTVLISMPFNNEQRIRATFDLIDLQHSAFITYEYFSNFFKTFMDVDDGHISLMFKELDTWETGKPKYNEFKDFCLSKPEYALLFMHFSKMKSLQMCL